MLREAMMKYIKLTKNQKAIVDDEDYEGLNKYKWHAHWSKKTKSYTAVRNINGTNKKIYMHREILNPESKLFVDHINHNTLDNRRKNLRLANPAQNNQNKRVFPHSSRYKGVTWNKEHRRWKAQIKNDGKTYFLGYYEKELEAAKSYNNAAKKLFKEYAHINCV